MVVLRRCRDDEQERILAIINAAAEVYRGSIPADCWHEPYMPHAELEGEIRSGVDFWGYEQQGRLIGVMGIQPVSDVDLIRHAYVMPGLQRHGVGAALMAKLRALSRRRMLVGTWAAATWAIRFYERQGFSLVNPAETRVLLTTYWNIPEKQLSASVVLSSSWNS